MNEPHTSPATPAIQHPAGVTPRQGGDLNVVAASFGGMNRLRRISWGAVFAGALVAIALQMLLSLLGMAIGFWSINPATEENPVAGLGAGTGIWWIITGALSLFVGGWFAGRLANVPNNGDGAMNGAVTWALVFLVGFYFVTTTLGQIVYGVAAPIGDAVAYLGQSATRMADTTAAERDALQRQQLEQDQWFDANESAIRQEAVAWLRSTGAEELQPEQLERDAQQLAETAQDTARQVVLRPGQASQELNQAIDRFFNELQVKRQAADKQAMINALARQTELSEDEARATVNRWERQYNQLQTRSEQAQEVLRQQWQDVKDQAAATTGNVLDSLGNAAMWTFFVMVVGVAAAVGGGAVGAPKRRDEHQHAPDAQTHHHNATM